MGVLPGCFRRCHLCILQSVSGTGQAARGQTNRGGMVEGSLQSFDIGVGGIIACASDCTLEAPACLLQRLQRALSVGPQLLDHAHSLHIVLSLGKQPVVATLKCCVQHVEIAQELGRLAPNDHALIFVAAAGSRLDPWLLRQQARAIAKNTSAFEQRMAQCQIG